MQDNLPTQQQVYKFRITCDEFPEAIEEDSIIYYDGADHSPVTVARELAEIYMSDNIYDWEDETEPSDLFEISVSSYDNTFVVTFFDNLTLRPAHKIIVQFQEAK